MALDVRDHDSIRTHGRRSRVAAAGKLDILVNNAGCNVRKPALDVTWDDWNLILDTNLRGVFFLAQAVARRHDPARLRPHHQHRLGHLRAGYAGLAPYGASRGGVKQLTMSLADDWGTHGITVNCLAPGWFKTAQNAVMYEDADVGRLPQRPHPAEAPRRARRPRRRAGLPRLRRQRLHHRADAARRRRHLRRRGESGAEEVALLRPAPDRAVVRQIDHAFTAEADAFADLRRRAGFGLGDRDQADSRT